ncbi:phage tail protein [Methylotenera oryzisoli]|uniref:Phage tail protein n=2 Tax=Methylotenera oryzisoli TaxID=2080758 RepID=A0A4Y9VST1_9PROT|nr:phage tail protein [Methylotenera oryzisoli]
MPFTNANKNKVTVQAQAQKMNKPSSLRTALEAALPELKKNPERVLVFIDKGQIVSTQAPTFSFEYHYTLNVIITDYSAHSDNIFIPLLVWVREHQPSLLTGKPDSGMSFEAEIINHKNTDISITLALTEAVIVTLEQGKLVSRHAEEPKLLDITGPTGWQLFANDNEVLQTPLEVIIQ